MYNFFQEIINANIIRPIIKSECLNKKNNIINDVLNRIIFSEDVIKTDDVIKTAESILNGNTVLFLEGVSEALVISTIGWKTRSIEEPEGEKALKGPREGFTESLIINLSI